MSELSRAVPATKLPLRRRGTRGERSLQVSTFRCEPLDDMEPKALGFTYWFDTEREGAPYPVSVRFVGRRLGVKGRPGRRDSFDVVETLDRVIPGSGPVAITTRVYDVAPGEWHVTATPTAETRRRGKAQGGASASGARLANASSSGATAYAPVIRIHAPGARLGAWPALVSLGVVAALATQNVLARRRDLPATRVLLVSLLASLIGLVAAKAYYLVEHRHEKRSVVTAGLCIQGFVLGAIAALAAGTIVAGVPVGRVLDVSTPGLLFAMTIGRFGCFFGGCCAGRPTGSRWGLWSSDRRLGVRRIPTQLLESLLAFTVGAVALVVVWSATPRPAGTVFVAAIAAYTAGRQLLFPLRDLPRHTAHGRVLTLAIAAGVMVAAIAVGALD